MASNKRSARAKQRAAFEAEFDGSAMGDLFARERERGERLDAEHGRRGLSAYRCPYCNGWHLTSLPR